MKSIEVHTITLPYSRVQLFSNAIVSNKQNCNASSYPSLCSPSSFMTRPGILYFATCSVMYSVFFLLFIEFLHSLNVGFPTCICISYSILSCYAKQINILLIVYFVQFRTVNFEIYGIEKMGKEISHDKIL